MKMFHHVSQETASVLCVVTSAIEKELKESTGRYFAYDTRDSKVIRSEDKGKMQNYLNEINKWAEENLMEFTSEKFEQESRGMMNNIMVTCCKGPTGKEIDSEEYIKDLGVMMIIVIMKII